MFLPFCQQPEITCSFSAFIIKFRQTNQLFTVINDCLKFFLMFYSVKWAIWCALHASHTFWLMEGTYQFVHTKWFYMFCPKFECLHKTHEHNSLLCHRCIDYGIKLQRVRIAVLRSPNQQHHEIWPLKRPFRNCQANVNFAAKNIPASRWKDTRKMNATNVQPIVNTSASVVNGRDLFMKVNISSL